MNSYDLCFSICYEHETKENATKELQRVKAEMDALKEVQYYKDEFPDLPFTFLPIDSMNDGKTKNTMTGNKSSQSCPDCKATPTQIKNNAVHIFENVKNLEWLKKGAKSLHNLPRTMEFLINAGAKIRIGKNRVSTDLDKAMRDEDEKKSKTSWRLRWP